MTEIEEIRERLDAAESVREMAWAIAHQARRRWRIAFSDISNATNARAVAVRRAFTYKMMGEVRVAFNFAKTADAEVERLEKELAEEINPPLPPEHQ